LEELNKAEKKSNKIRNALDKNHEQARSYAKSLGLIW
jgi:hypothetical protein